MNVENIGKYLKELRIKSKLTQEELAHKLHVTRQAVSSWENGRFIPDIEKIYDLANIYDVKIEDIYAGGPLKSNYVSNDIFIDKIHTEKKKFLIFGVIIIAAFILLFLSYYFFNSYRKTNLYIINSETGSSEVTGNIFKVNKNVFLNLMVNDINSDSICLYYKEKELTCVENSKIIKFSEKLGYGEYVLTDSFDEFIENLYVKTSSDKIKLNISKYFINDELIFNKSKSVETNNKNNAVVNDNVSKYIVDNFEYDTENNIYFNEEKINGKLFDVQFDLTINNIVIKNKDEKNLKVWSYDSKERKFINYIEYNNQKLLHNYNEEEIKELSQETYDCFFGVMNTYIDNILK